ncbi:hypothetical protein [Cognatishimia maritima]|nr:hypothetical protein [Cognatishimia maritima]
MAEAIQALWVSKSGVGRPGGEAAENVQLSVPLDPDTWLADRHAQMVIGLQ